MTRGSLARLERAMARMTCRHCGRPMSAPSDWDESPMAPADAAELDRLMPQCACGRRLLTMSRMSEADRAAFRALLARLRQPPGESAAPADLPEADNP